MTTKKPNGMTECTLQDILFPVKFIDNTRRANSENSKVVVGTITETISMTETELEERIIEDLENDVTVKVVKYRLDLNYCSPRYELVPNADIFPKIEEILNAHNIEFTKEYFHTDFVRFYVNYTITDARYSYNIDGTSDTIYPMLKVQHSYNGMTKYRIMFGYFRFVCSNGLVIAVEDMKQFNLCLTGKHTKAIQGSLLQLTKLMDTFVVDAKNITTIIARKYEFLASHTIVKVQERIEEVLKYAGIIAVENKNLNTVQHIYNTVMSEANKEGFGYNGVANDWLIYNGINQYLHDNTLNIAAPEKRIETDSKVFEYMLKA